MAKEWKKNGCPYCSLNCNLEVLVENDKIIDVRPDPDSVKEPGGYCCRKGRSVKYFQDNPERVNYPLKKVGDHFERISWEQAYTEIGAKAKGILEQYGPKAFALCGFGSASGTIEGPARNGFMSAIGGQYKYNPIGFEFMGLYWSLGRILGNQNIYPEPDDKKVDTIIYWGANSYVASHFIPAHRRYIREMSENENKTVVVVDPRLSETARMADFHIMPRNGCDAMFIRGLIAMILDKNLEDKEFLAKYCSDWDKAKLWYQDFDYRKAFEVAHVPYEHAEKLVHLLTTTTWGCHAELGIICGKHNTLNSYMLISLMAVTGNFMVKGNVLIDGILRGGPAPDEIDPSVWRLEESGAFPVQGTYPVGKFAGEVLSEKETRHRAVFVCKSNPARSYPETALVEKALDHLDLLVVMEMAMSETAMHADYVLPSKTGFEMYDMSFFPLTYPEVVFFLRHPVIGQIAERKDHIEIMVEISRRMGLVPEMPEELVQMAAISCQRKDLPIFMGPFMQYLQQHPENMRSMILMILDVFARPECLGSYTRAAARLLAAVDYVVQLGIPQRGGFKPYPHYQNAPVSVQAMSIMDQVFWAADENPSGIVVGYVDPDDESRARSHIFFEDKKIHLFDPVVQENLGTLTPEAAEAELQLNDEFDMVVSSGNHKDSGVDNYMRNPDTYIYRKPYVLSMNPDDAADRGIKEGDVVRIVTKTGEMTAPAEISYMVNRGYCMIPHHFGLVSSRHGTYGMSANSITSSQDLDEITGDPTVRYVPGRVEKIVSGEGGNP